MQAPKISLKSLPYIGFLVIIIVAIVLIPQAQIQGRASDLLGARFGELGIPVNAIRIIHRLPLQIEIILQSTSSDKTAAQADLWNKHLVMRETELLYLTGPQIKSYRLILINTKGEEISSERVFLDPSLPSQNLSVPAPATIDNDTTNDLIQSKINTFGLRLSSINVLTNEIVRENTKLVTLRLTADSPDPDASINAFIPTLRPFFKDINTTYAAQISLLHLFITVVLQI